MRIVFLRRKRDRLKRKLHYCENYRIYTVLCEIKFINLYLHQYTVKPYTLQMKKTLIH